MSTVPSPGGAAGALAMVHAGLGYLAAADAAQLPAAAQAGCLRGLERSDAIAAAARAGFVAAFTAGQGYRDDADYSALAWLMHRTGITRGAAAGHTAWAGRAAAHPEVLAALAAGQVSESDGRLICRWTGKLPEQYREESGELLAAAAVAGLGLPELAAMAAEMSGRARAELPDEDPDGPLEDRALRLETTFGGAGVVHGGDLTPECAAVPGAVLDALSAPTMARTSPPRSTRSSPMPGSGPRSATSGRPA